MDIENTVDVSQSPQESEAKDAKIKRVHPGLGGKVFDFTSPIPPLPESKKGEFFEFVNKDGLSSEEITYTTELLDELFAETSRTWVPYGCKEFSEESRRAYNDGKVLDPPSELNYDLTWVQTGDGTHHWLELVEKKPSDERYDARRLIIDPTGLDVVNEAGKYNDAEYQPYFGLAENAPDELKTAYYSEYSHIYFDKNGDRLGIETVKFNPKHGS